MYIELYTYIHIRNNNNNDTIQLMLEPRCSIRVKSQTSNE